MPILHQTPTMVILPFLRRLPTPPTIGVIPRDIRAATNRPKRTWGWRKHRVTSTRKAGLKETSSRLIETGCGITAELTCARQPCGPTGGEQPTLLSRSDYAEKTKRMLVITNESAAARITRDTISCRRSLRFTASTVISASPQRAIE